MRRTVVYADRRLHWQAAKTAIGVIRYCPDEVVAVIDSEYAGKSVAEALEVDFGDAIPVVPTLADALPFRPNTFLVGTSPQRPTLSDDLRAVILAAVECGLDIVSGLHIFLADDPEIAARARRHGVNVSDLRRAPVRMDVVSARPHREGTCTVLAVGSDCCIGKKTVMLELDRAARRRGWRSDFLATGQTGIMIAGGGIPADRTISDFLPGVIEQEVLRRLETNTWLFVEGQAGLNHPGGSGVSLALIHGARPDALIVCHDPRTATLTEYPHVPLPSIDGLIRMNEVASSWTGAGEPARAVGISLITKGMSDEQARALLARTERKTGLVATDSVRYGVEPLLDALDRFFVTRGVAL